MTANNFENLMKWKLSCANKIMKSDTIQYRKPKLVNKKKTKRERDKRQSQGEMQRNREGEREGN